MFLECAELQPIGTNAFFVANEFSNLFEILDPIKSFKHNPYNYPKDKKEKIISQVKNHKFINL